MDDVINLFLDYLKFERFRSAHTVDSYGRDLCSFKVYLRSLEGDVAWNTADSDVIRGWMEKMFDEGNSASSVNRRLSCLRAFYRFLLSRKLVEKDPANAVKGPKKGKPLPQYLREDEMNRLLQDDFWGDDYVSLTEKTVVLMFYSTGIRLSELVGLDDSSVDFASLQIKVLGKRNKERIIPVGPELLVALREYRSKRDGEVVRLDDAMFVSKSGVRLTAEKVRGIVRKNLSKVSSLKKRSPHVLRHTFATAMLNNGAGLESIQKLLGHESVATTEIYTHTTFAQLKKAYSEAHPRGEEIDK